MEEAEVGAALDSSISLHQEALQEDNAKKLELFFFTKGHMFKKCNCNFTLFNLGKAESGESGRRPILRRAMQKREVGKSSIWSTCFKSGLHPHPNRESIRQKVLRDGVLGLTNHGEKQMTDRRVVWCQIDEA
jgi:hypothetical protein